MIVNKKKKKINKTISKNILFLKIFNYKKYNFYYYYFYIII